MASPYQSQLLRRVADWPRNDSEETARAREIAARFGDNMLAGIKAARIERRVVELLSYEMRELDVRIRTNVAARTRIMQRASRESEHLRHV